MFTQASPSTCASSMAKVLSYQNPAMSVDDRTPPIFDASRPSPNVTPAHCKGLTLANLTPGQAQHLSNAFKRQTNPHTSDAGIPPELAQSLLNDDVNRYACPLHTLSWACGPLLLALAAAFLTLSSPVCPLVHPVCPSHPPGCLVASPNSYSDLHTF